MYLEQINGPQDVKKLSVEQLNTLADEMRAALLNRLSKHGGHFGPNFGMVEATIALHYVFESPKDKIVYDVSHQSYPHKMLTGRMLIYTKNILRTCPDTAIQTKVNTTSLPSVTPLPLSASPVDLPKQEI